jgi:hypothetical protein
MYKGRKVSLYTAKYYPLVGGNAEQPEYTPMIPYYNERQAKDNHEIYLAEIVSGNYRLCSAHGCPAPGKSYIIHCPVCGNRMKELKCSARNPYYRSVYICSECKARKRR